MNCMNVIGRSECMHVYYVTLVHVNDIHLTASPVASCMMALSGLVEMALFSNPAACFFSGVSVGTHSCSS